jgi:hypothetical protein
MSKTKVPADQEPIESDLSTEPHNFIVSQRGIEVLLAQFRPQQIIRELESHFALKYLEYKGHQVPGAYILHPQSPFFSLLNFCDYVFLRYREEAEKILGRSRIPKLKDLLVLQQELLNKEAADSSKERIPISALVEKVNDPHSSSVITDCVWMAYSYYLRTLPQTLDLAIEELLAESVAYTLSRIQKDAGMNTAEADKSMIAQMAKVHRLALNNRWQLRPAGATSSHNKAELKERYKALLSNYQQAKKEHDKYWRSYQSAAKKKSSAGREGWRGEWVEIATKRFPKLYPQLLALYAFNDDADIEPYPSALAKRHLAHEKGVGVAYIAKLLKGP